MHRRKAKKYTNKEITNIVDNLTDKELKDTAKRYLEINNNKIKETSNFDWKIFRKAYIFGVHRTNFYKKKKPEYINLILFVKE